MTPLLIEKQSTRKNILSDLHWLHKLRKNIESLKRERPFPIIADDLRLVGFEHFKQFAVGKNGLWPRVDKTSDLSQSRCVFRCFVLTCLEILALTEQALQDGRNGPTWATNLKWNQVLSKGKENCSIETSLFVCYIAFNRLLWTWNKYASLSMFSCRFYHICSFANRFGFAVGNNYMLNEVMNNGKKKGKKKTQN